jgi:hypothetical protein
MSFWKSFAGLWLLAFATTTQAAGFLDQFGLGKSATANVGNLTQEQMTSGLKEALSKGVEHAVSILGRTNGFLNDLKVKIPIPDNLRKIESTMRALGEGQVVDEFTTNMNRAAEQAVPEAASVLGESVRQMSISDAQRILTTTNNGATEYFRRTAGTNLYAKFLPIVQRTTAATGATAGYKKLLERMNSGEVGKVFGLFGKSENLDIDTYVTRKAIDGFFVKIAEQEQLIRQNPAARSSEILQKVFGAMKQ